MRHALTDTLMSVGALVLLLGVLVALDDRVREEIAWRVNDQRPASDVQKAEAHARSFVTVVVDVAHDQVREHTPMMLFAFAGTALVLFMLRT